MLKYEFTFQEPMEIKLLILYIVYQSKSIAKQESVERTFLCDFIAENIRVNYFDMQIQLSTLCEDGHLRSFVSNFKDKIKITEKGTYAIESFATNIPHSVRDRIDSIIYDSVNKYRDQQTVAVDYWKESETLHTAVLNILEDEKNIFKLHISLPDAIDAQILKTKFKENPGFFYSQIIEMCSRAIDEGKKDSPKE